MMLEDTAGEAQAADRALAIVAKGTGMAVVGRAAGGAMGYAFSVLVARWLGAGDLGLFSLAFTVVALAMVVGRVGLDEAVLRFVALYRGEGAAGKAKGTVQLALRISLVGSVVLMIVVIAAAGAIANGFGKPELAWVLRALACTMPLGNLALVALAATQACRVMTYVTLTTGIVAPLLQLAVVVLLLATGTGLASAVIASVVAQCAAAVLGYRFAGRVMPALRDARVATEVETGRVLRFAAPMTVVQLIGFLMSWLDTLLLGLYVSSRELGVYSAAVRTAALTSFILIGVNALFAPTMADLFNRGERAVLERLFKITTKWALTVALPLFLLCALRGRELLALFGPEFPLAAAPLAVLAAGQFVNAATGSVGYMLVMSGRQDLLLADQIGGLVLAVTLNLWLIPLWGLLGAAVAMGATAMLVNLVRLTQVAWLLRLHPYDASFRSPLLAATGALVVAAAVARFIGPLPDLAALSVSVVTFAAVYATLLIGFGLSREDRMVLDRVRSRLGLAHS